MKMQEKSVLTDCLESLKHAAERYQAAAFESDTDHVRDTMQDIMFDRCEQQASVFSLMHQMGLYKTDPAPAGRVQDVREQHQSGIAQMESRHHAVEGEHAGDPKAR